MEAETGLKGSRRGRGATRLRRKTGCGQPGFCRGDEEAASIREGSTTGSDRPLGGEENTQRGILEKKRSRRSLRVSILD